jgi:hypothetical protein
MKDNTPLNEDILLDRLVDGELTADERRELLQSFDQRPEGWRRCALAFLEAQSWREELGQVARESAAATRETKSPVPSVGVSRKSMWTTGAMWLAMAAGLLVAFGLGTMRREPGQMVANNSGVSADQVASTPATSNAPAQSKSKQGDAVTLFVRDEGGRMNPVRVPLVDASTLDKELGVQFKTGVPDDVRSQLKSDGYAVQTKRQYAPLWLENGRPMILPVEDTKIVPVSNRVY